jgi:hypothetical protein
VEIVPKLRKSTENRELKVPKDAFDAALRKMIQAKPTKRSEITTKRGKRD